ncbi:LuxR C-terminal-related transcriptional regulator [Chryseobacterium sp.]|uniref:helix-turn-helix transcriptional regulator n=1 Tax=Chryseobacterium sp. TaxID=1871047 RepID=UPI002897176D|nr:LuxR C-terminal-related transcriptional regulator [Chryseobacterium sp.]
MNIKYFLEKAAFCLLLFLGVLSSGRSATWEVDSLRKEINNKWLNKGDFNSIILAEKKLIIKCKKLGYIPGEIQGYINIANALSCINRNKESLQFLDIARKKLTNYNDAGLEAQMNHVYGVNYFSLGLHKRALQRFNKALEAAKRISHEKEKQSIQYSVYDWKRSCFGFLGLVDSVYSNERKCMKSPMPMLYITIANRHFKNNNIDSAEYYINKANHLLLIKKIPVEGKANVLRAYGRLNIEKKEYNKSLQYLLESLTITHGAGLRKRTLETYKLLAIVYKRLNNLQKENEYLAKYSRLNDSLRESEKVALNTSVEDILASQEEDFTASSKNFYYGFASIILVSTAIILIIDNVHKVRYKKQDKMLNEKKHETDILRRKLENLYEEVVQLAIKSDPSFIHKFREAYSEFYDNLTKENPTLTANDILFCAYIKLNFSNKEIAEYAHLSIRTVESKKYRLKKKLGISSESDFNKWITKY